MFGLGITEIVALLVIALVVIGPKQLPELARNLGRFFNELKRTSNVFAQEFKESMREDLKKQEPPAQVHPLSQMPAAANNQTNSPVATVDISEKDNNGNTRD